MEAKINQFAKESLNRDDTIALTVFLYSFLVSRFQFTLYYLNSELLGYSDRTIRDWRSIFISNEGSFPDSQQGKYQ